MICDDRVRDSMRDRGVEWSFEERRCYQTLSSQLWLLQVEQRGGGLGSRPKKMYGERLGDGIEYHLMSPTPRR